MSEVVYIGHDNDIRLILKQNSVASDLASVTQIDLVLGTKTISSTNNANDSIRWAQAGYATGEVRMELGGTKLITTWTAYSGSIWQATVTTKPTEVTINGTYGTKKTTIALTTANDWYWASGVLYLYSVADPDTYASPGVEGEWPIPAGTYRTAPLIVYDATAVDGIVWGSLDVTVYGRKGGGPFIP